MKKNLYTIAFLFLSALCFANDFTVELNGKTIVLHDDFTWEYQSLANTLEAPAIVLVKNPNADKVLRSKTNKFIINIDSTVWNQMKSTNTSAEFSFQNNASTGFGMLIFDGLSIPLSSMKEILILNANNIDPDAKITNIEKCTVNGTEGELVTYTAKGSGLQFTLCSFIATKNSGTIQFTFYTLSDVFEELKPAFLDAISGIEFTDM